MKLRPEANRLISSNLLFSFALVAVGVAGLWWQGKPAIDMALFAVFAMILCTTVCIIAGLFYDMHLSNQEGWREMNEVKREVDAQIGRVREYGGAEPLSDYDIERYFDKHERASKGVTCRGGRV